jgi:O-antigen biosynthesis protein
MNDSASLGPATADRGLLGRALSYMRRHGWRATAGRTLLWLRTRRVLAWSNAAARTRLGAAFHKARTLPDELATGRIRRQFRAQAAAELEAFLADGARLVLPQADAPDISILIVLYNQAPLTYRCLRSISGTADLPVEIVIVDNASADRTGELLDRIDGANIVRNSENLHFLRATNQAAERARGRALLLLNNDAMLSPGALRAARETLFSAEDVGAVGGKLVLPSGRLQEAGSIVWSDGSSIGYGRDWMPDAPECQFRRQVDYCSGAFLLVRRDLFERLGRFDIRFAPAYYEETDLCLRLREHGYRIVYDPRAEIRHFEFGSSQRSAQAFALMRRNQALFREIHAPALRRQRPPVAPQLFARDPGGATRILAIDDRVPFPADGSGFPRAASILKRLWKAGFFITHYPLTEPRAVWDEVRAEHPLEIEFMIGYGAARFSQFLEARAGYYDLILISRPHNMARFIEERAAHPGWYRGVAVVYDAEATFALRELRRIEIEGVALSAAEKKARVAAEIELAGYADAVVAVNEAEASIFRAAGIANVHVLGHALSVEPTGAGFAERRDFLLVGALREDDSPNVDGLLWFVREVMPRLDAAIGQDYRVRVAGEARAPALKRLRDPRVELLGRIEDLGPEYARARVFVGPTRFAAGMPHKLHEAAARGVPIVATDLLATQLGWSDGVELLSAGSAEGLARQAARLYRDAALWGRLRNAALDRVARDCSPADFDARLATVITSMDAARLRP